MPGHPAFRASRLATIRCDPSGVLCARRRRRSMRSKVRAESKVAADAAESIVVYGCPTTFKGTGLEFLEFTPSWPVRPEPQQYNVPVVVRPQE